MHKLNKIEIPSFDSGLELATIIIAKSFIFKFFSFKFFSSLFDCVFSSLLVSAACLYIFVLLISINKWYRFIGLECEIFLR